MHTGLRRLLGGFAPLAALLLAGPAAAEEAAASGLNSGDVAWILTSSAIVLLMTIPGLAFFYGGLVRGKNVLSVLMHCFICAGLISVTWVLWGYSIAFGGEGALWGGLSKLGLSGVSHLAGPEENIPEQLFMVFQLMFAIITPALIAGAIAERMKFSAFFLFVLLWSTFIYSPLCHWVWGEGGWLGARGALDFAGGTVVHISSGVSALVAVLVLGKRQGFGREPLMPHNLPFTVMGAGLLWVGWFGFNAGSALAANGSAVAAFVNTNTATGAAVLGWVFTEWLSRGKPTALGAATGAVAGLVAITPAAGFVTPLGSILIGLVAGFLCYQACNLKVKLGYDDALDVVGVHGVGGTWGALATGVLASAAVGGTAGGMGQLFEQIVAVLATYVFAGVGTFVILQIVEATVGLRVHEDDESQGLDLSEHSETAYIH
jgi:Amt family ammonium transporter